MDQKHIENTKRVAKNTGLLYLRTIVMMFISIYTSRIVLEALGVDNYGINNVVGGVVGMFSIISGPLTGSISRFLTFALGEENKEKLQKVFSLSINIQIFIGLIVIFIAEIIGVWFINNKLNIPPDRLIAAHWVFQLSLISFFIGLVNVPYGSCLVAHERMGVFAYMTIIDVVIKLLFAYAIFVTPFDKLITFAVLNVSVGIIMRIIYGIYCVRNFDECRYKWTTFDKSLAKEMTSFAWWGFFGNTAWMFNTQGVNILINMFFGVAFNAARGVAGQIEGAVMGFVGNFTTALNPQIIKSYASGDTKYLFSLICRGAKYTFFLILFFMIPVCLEADTLLSLWLKEVPPDSALFLRLSVMCTITTQFGGTAYNAIMATGKVRIYHITVTVIGCLVFPLTWVAYKIGLPVEATYYIFAPIYLILIGVRLLFLKKLMDFQIIYFVKEAIVPSLMVLIFSLIFPIIVVLSFPDNVFRLAFTTLVSILSVSLSVWFCGMTFSERNMIRGVLIKRFGRFKFVFQK